MAAPYPASGEALVAAVGPESAHSPLVSVLRVFGQSSVARRQHLGPHDGP